MLLCHGIDDKAVAEGGRSLVKGDFLDAVLGKMLVQFEKSLLIAGQADILLVDAISEVDADDGMDAVFLCFSDKGEDARGGVDVCQCECVEFLALGFSDQRLHRHRPVFEAEV